MKRPVKDTNWPESWKMSFEYDLEEVFGESKNLGYSLAYRSRQAQTIKLLEEVAGEGARVLDIAAAQGNFSLTLAERGFDVTWNDLRGELIDYVRLKYESGNLTFAPGNVFELNFDALFDVVLITEIIEHVAHPDEFLLKVSRLVKPGGYIIMTTPNGGYFLNKLPKFSDCADPSIYEKEQFKPNSDGHIFLLHPSEVPGLAMAAGLKVEQLSLFTNPWTNGHLKSEALLRVFPRSFVDAVERISRLLPAPVASKVLVQMGARFQKAENL